MFSTKQRELLDNTCEAVVVLLIETNCPPGFPFILLTSSDLLHLKAFQGLLLMQHDAAIAMFHCRDSVCSVDEQCLMSTKTLCLVCLKSSILVSSDRRTFFH